MDVNAEAAAVAPLEAPSHVNKLVRNIVSAAASHIGSTLVVLAITPLLLHRLGLEAYGVWAFISAIAKYGLVADFGLGPSITRFVAEYHLRGEYEKIQQTVTFGALFYLVLGALVVPGFMLVSSAIFAHVKLSVGLRAIAPGIATGFVTWLLLDMAASVLRSLLSGLGYLGDAAKSIAIAQVVFAASAVILTQHGLGLQGMLDALWIQLSVSVTLLAVAARRRFGRWYIISPFSLRAAVVKPLFAVSSWIQLSTLMSVIYNESGQLIVGVFVNVATSGLYDMGTKLSAAIRALSNYFSSGLLPVIARLDTQYGGRSAATAFIRATRYQALVTFFAGGLLIGAAPAILHLWLGTDVHHINTIVSVMTVLCPVYLIDSICTVAITTLRAVGTPRLETAYSVVAAAFHVGFTMYLAPRYGLPGILAGLFIGTVVASLNFLYFFGRMQKTNLWDLMRGWLVRLSCILALSANAIAYIETTYFRHLWTTRPGTLVSFCILGFIYTGLFVGGLKLSSFFDAEDGIVVAKILPKRIATIFDALFIGGQKAV